MFFVLILFIAGCGSKAPEQTVQQQSQVQVDIDSLPAQTSANINTVELIDFSFQPNEIIIAKGETVEWVNRDSAKHSVIDDNNKFNSQLIGKDEIFTYTFNEAGTYSYYCGLHPFMKATVIVK